MNIKCKCGEIYRVNIPKLDMNLDAYIYTDGVIEGGSIPRDIKIFRCSTCNEFIPIEECEKVDIQGQSTLTEPESQEYLELIRDEKYDTLGIRIKAWQRANDRYRNIDSLEDLGVKIELLKAQIATIPDTTQFDIYIGKMEKKYSEMPSEIILKKIDELKVKKMEIIERLKEKEHLKNLEEEQADARGRGEVEVLYSKEEIQNMEYILDNLDNSDTSFILKAEINRNLGRFEEAISIANQISEKHYKDIASTIISLSEKKLKKVERLKD